MSNGRDGRFDVLKGMAICLMVAVHARANASFCDFVVLFHMPVFFVLAGWFFDFESTKTALGSVAYSLKKVRRLWVPYLVWSIVFICLHDIMAGAFLFADVGVDRTLDTCPNVIPLTFAELAWQLLLAPVMLSWLPPFAGAFWFLKSLLFALAGYCWLTWAIRKMHGRFLILQSGIALLALIMGHYWTPRVFGAVGGSSTLVAYALIHLGVLSRKFEFQLTMTRCSVLVAGACFCGLILILAMFGTNSPFGKDGNMFVTIVSALLGWHLLLNVQKIVPAWLLAILAYIGRHTMPILLFHFLAFKVVSLAGTHVNGDPIWKIAEFPVTYRGLWWSVAYAVVGVSIPLAMQFLSQTFLGMVLKRK